MSKHHNQNYSQSEIAAIRELILGCVEFGHFYVSTGENREENKRFISEYNFTNERIGDLLSAIEVADFCHSLKNTKPGYEHEILYVFCRQTSLYNLAGTMDLVEVYTKFNVINSGNGNRVVVISLHPRNKPIDYCFLDLREGKE